MRLPHAFNMAVLTAEEILTERGDVLDLALIPGVFWVQSSIDNLSPNTSTLPVLVKPSIETLNPKTSTLPGSVQSSIETLNPRTGPQPL